MPLFILIILALIQGITEFLPISSSGHLILAHNLLSPETNAQALKQNLLIDVAVHVGTLFSVLLYFRADLLTMITGVKDIVFGNHKSPASKLNTYIIISSIPVIIAGFVLNYFAIYWGNAVTIIAWTTLIFGIALWVIDAKKPTTKTLNDMTAPHALIIGLAQALALIPGTSRSGITMTAARYLGYDRAEAARYSLLLAIIAIAGAGTLASINLIKMGDINFTIDAAIAMIFAFTSGLAAISIMMKWLERASFKIFAIYRIILGASLLALLYTGIL